MAAARPRDLKEHPQSLKTIEAEFAEPYRTKAERIGSNPAATRHKQIYNDVWPARCWSQHRLQRISGLSAAACC